VRCGAGLGEQPKVIANSAVNEVHRKCGRFPRIVKVAAPPEDWGSISTCARRRRDQVLPSAVEMINYDLSEPAGYRGRHLIPLPVGGARPAITGMDDSALLPSKGRMASAPSLTN
jgi:hypothetical protein